MKMKWTDSSVYMYSENTIRYYWLKQKNTENDMWYIFIYLFICKEKKEMVMTEI